MIVVTSQVPGWLGVLHSHPTSKLSISGSRYTLMFFLGYFGPGIIIDTNMFLDPMMTPGGRFRGITNMGQQLYVVDDMPYGLNPSVDIATAMLLGLLAFKGYILTKFCHA
jgi:hypothetical protein